MVDVVVVDVIPVMPLVTRLLVSCARLTFDDVLSPPSAARINFQIMKLCTGEISDNEFALKGNLLMENVTSVRHKCQSILCSTMGM